MGYWIALYYRIYAFTSISSCQDSCHFVYSTAESFLARIDRQGSTVQYCPCTPHLLRKDSCRLVYFTTPSFFYSSEKELIGRGQLCLYTVKHSVLGLSPYTGGLYSATMADDGLACIACILEYLEANKRIHITARSPVLQNFACSVPLRLDKLIFRDDSICLNSITYTIKNHLRQEANWNEEDFRNEPRTEKLLPGDFLIPPKNGIWTVARLGIYFNNKDQNATKMLPPGSQKPFALKFLSNSILGYDSVFASSLLIDFKAQNPVLRVPVDFQVRVRNMDTRSHRFTDFLSIIHPDSLPLKSLTTTIYTSEDLDHTLLKTSERVVIRPSEFKVTIQRLRDLTNKHVEINWYNVSLKKLDQLIIFWKRTWKETGSTWHSMYLGKRGTLQALQTFQDKFNGFKAFWVAPKEKINKMGVCIPMNFKSELFICGETIDKKNCFEMTVLAKGTVRPHVQKRKFNDEEEE